MQNSDEADELREFSEKRNRWIESINAGKPDDFVSVLAEDAVWLPSGQSAIEGKDRIRSWVAAPFSEYSYDYSVDDIRVRIAGDWAVERASFRTRMVNDEGIEAAIHDGEYTILWHRLDSRG